MNKYSFKWIAIGLSTVWLSLTTQVSAEPLELVKIKVNQQHLEVELADTPQERAKGLMERKDAKPGMLFVYPYPKQTAFWMANTLIPLDLAYIDENGVITSIIQMKALDETTHPSPGKVIAALEMELGWFAKNNVKVGDKIEFDN